VTAVLDHLTPLPEADLTRTDVLGQSHGGLTTLAFGTLNRPGLPGLVDFAGELRNTDCVAWERGLRARVARALASAGAPRRHVPAACWYPPGTSTDAGPP
jgi:dienelactone hydrolase